MRGAHEKERVTPPFIRVTANQAAKHGWEYRWNLKNKVFGLQCYTPRRSYSLRKYSQVAWYGFTYVYLDSSLAPPPRNSVVVSSKESLIPGPAFVGSNFELGEGVFFTQSH